MQSGNVGSEASPSPEGRRTKTLVGLVSLLALVAIVVVAAVLLSGGGSNRGKKITLISNQRTKTRVTSSPTSTTIASTTSPTVTAVNDNLCTDQLRQEFRWIDPGIDTFGARHTSGYGDTCTAGNRGASARDDCDSSGTAAPDQSHGQNKSVSITNPNLYLLAGSFSVPNNAAPWVLWDRDVDADGRRYPIADLDH